MIWTPKKKRSQPLMEPKPYCGVCIGVYYVGEQESTWNNQTKQRNELVFVFEFPSATYETGGIKKAYELSKTLTFTPNVNGSLIKFLNDWNGGGVSEDTIERFDPECWAGKSALIQVSVTEKGSNAIGSIMSLPDGFPQPTPTTTPTCFHVDFWDDDVFQGLPAWVRERIMRSKEYRMEHVPDDTVEIPASNGQQDTSGVSDPETANKPSEVPF